MKSLHLSRQHGAALLTALVFLVILTLLGIGVYSTTTSEERMARNFRDKKIALQAAEAALNEAKIWITASYNTSAPPATLPQALTSDICDPPIGYTEYASSTLPGIACHLKGDSDYTTYDLFASITNSVEVGSNNRVPNVSPNINVNSLLAARPRYLVILEADSSMCGLQSTPPYCFTILAQAQGRMGTTRVNIIEQFTN